MTETETKISKNALLSYDKSAFFVGGEGEIRTLELLLTVTRFPVARARPTTRLLHREAVNGNSVCCVVYLTACSLYHADQILSIPFPQFLFSNLYKSFILFFEKIHEKVFSSGLGYAIIYHESMYRKIKRCRKSSGKTAEVPPKNSRTVRKDCLQYDQT